MTRTTLAALALALPSAAAAQGACPSEDILASLDPCLVGNWIGSNSALDAFQRAMEGMPGVSVAPDMPPVLGMKVYPDGYYITLPFHAGALTSITDDDGTSTLRLDMAVPTAVGRIWTDRGILSMCQDSEIPPLVAGVGTAPDGATGSFTLSPGPGGAFVPLMTYSCSGDHLDFTVMLPDPVGSVDYNLTRFPDSRYEDAFVRLSDERFGRD